MSQSSSQIMSGREALKRLGSMVVFITGLIQFIVGIGFIGMSPNDVNQVTFIMLFLSGLTLLTLAILEFAYEWIDKIKLNPVVFTLVSMFIIVISFFLPFSGNSLVWVQVGNVIGLIGIFFMFVALRPNFGPTGNKKIYQAVAGIMAFFISILLFFLGTYVISLVPFDTLNAAISNFAGNGTYPGNFFYAFIEPISDLRGIETYEAIRTSGFLLCVTAIYIILVAMIRNRVSLKIASILLMIGIIWAIADLILFYDQWNSMNDLFLVSNPLEFESILKLSDPGVTVFGTILVLFYCISLMMLIYASFASKPIQQWRRKRDASIAAAEVFFREGKLPNAIKYLERAAQLSSKIDEEDKAVELLTRIKQIRDKAIKMRKAVAAEKAKKQYAKQKKQASPPKKKVSAKDAEVEAKMKKAMEKKKKK